MKKTIKRIGMEDGRVTYKVTIRKDHLAEDYAEMIRIQERSSGKCRFYIYFEGLTDTECSNFPQFALQNNSFRNAYLRKDCFVNISSVRLVSQA